ncbi:hypothetical protein Dimus_030023 [Dionaea muscipula]
MSVRAQHSWYGIERKFVRILQHKHTRRSLLQVHAFMLRNALETNVILFTKFIGVCTSAITMPDPFPGVYHARRTFDNGPHKHDTFLCNIMIKAHKDNHQFAESWRLYRDLRRRDASFLPDTCTLLSLAKCCSLDCAFWEGKQLHGHVIRDGFSLDLFVSTAIADVYVKLGDMVCAQKVFDEMNERSLVSWTVIVCGYARSGEVVKAREYFDQMPEKDLPAFNAIIDAYVKIGDLNSARSLFDGMSERNVISWTTLIYGYCNNGRVELARELFDVMPEKNICTWNAMIGGYCQNKQPRQALELFHELQASTVFEPDEFTIASVLAAIADLVALDLGIWVHHYAQRRRLDKTVNVCTALIDMYAKCGEINKALCVFEATPMEAIAPCNAMINGFALNGCCEEALEFFQKFLCRGMKPNEITMIGVLSACNHGGLVEEGRRWLKEMDRFGLFPRVEHYGCVIDLLGRAGCLHEAEKLFECMPYEANDIIMSSLLSACGYYRDSARAERILNMAVKMNPSNDGNYVLLRNVYAMDRRWTDVEETKDLMRRSGAKKQAGCSIVEVDNMVLEFVSGDKMHPKWDATLPVLKWLQMHTREQKNELLNL